MKHEPYRNHVPQNTVPKLSSQTHNRFPQSLEPTKSCRGRVTLCLAFYLGMGTLLLFLVAGAVLFPSPGSLTDQHANPVPARPLPAEVLVSSGSNLYHAGASCPYKHQHSQQLATTEAVQQGLIPCPYCIGNSSTQLTPFVISHRALSAEREPFPSASSAQ